MEGRGWEGKEGEGGKRWEWQHAPIAIFESRRLCLGSRALERSVCGAENGAEQAKSQMSGERESEKTSGARSGRSRSGSGAVSGLNLPLMAAVKSVVLCTVSTLHSAVYVCIDGVSLCERNRSGAGRKVT